MSCRLPRVRNKGAAAVEFALVLPLFLLMVFGAIDFGYFLYVSEVVTNAAREGARAGSVVEAACGAEVGCTLADLADVARADAKKAAEDYMVRGGLSLSGSVVAGVIQSGAADVSCEGDQAVPVVNAVCVEIQYPVGSVTGFLTRWIPTRSRAHATMRWQ